jgi:hypothetical protein
VVLGCVLLTTCGTDSLGPRPPVRGELDFSSLLALRDFPITVDEILIELRRTDETIAFQQTVTDFSTNGSRYRVQINVTLNESPETFALHAEVRAGGVTYYEVNSTVTAASGRTITTDPITPVYVGPGATADSLAITLDPASVTPGGTSTATAAVYASGVVVTGVPVEITSSDTTLVQTAATGLATAAITTTATSEGSYTITARIPNGLTQTAVLAVVGATTGADSLEVISSPTQAGIVNQLVASQPAVRVLDVNSQPLANVPVVFTVVTGGGTIIGGNAVTDSEGDAILTSWRLGQTAGTQTVQAAVSGLAPVTFTATAAPTVPLTIVKVSGDAQTDSAGRQLAAPLVAEVRDSFANPVPNATYSWAATDGTLGTPTGTTDPQGRATTTWSLGLAQASPTATITAGQAQTIFTATTQFGQPTILLSWSGIPGVGIGLTSTVNVNVSVAPQARLAIALASSNTGLFTVPAPDTVYINAGQTTGSKTINGISSGSATLTATAPGYQQGTLTVDVQNRNISLPPTLNVPYGQTASLPIQLPAPAPAGGVTFSVVSSDPTRISVAAPTVTIAAGGQTANATLNGVLPGPADITVSNPAYVTGISRDTTRASLNVVEGFVGINASFGGSITINFESNGTAQAAPAPGIAVTITGRHPTCVGVQSPRTIATGVVNVTSALTYGGSATLPCADTLVVTASNLQPDSVIVQVTPTPTITLNISSGGQVGHQLQESASFSLGASNHGGVSVTLTSSDPANVVLSSSQSVAGTGTLVVPILPGGTSSGFWVQSRTATNGSATITATAPNFSNGTAPVTVVTPGVETFGLANTTTLSTNTQFYSQVGLPNGQNTGLNRAQNVSPGLAGPIVVTSTSQFPSVAVIVDSTNTPTGAATGHSVITGGIYYTTGGIVQSYGTTLRPLTAGDDTVTVSIPGFTTMSVNGVRGFTVTQPTISISPNSPTVGAALQENATVFLSASNHGGATVTVTSSNPAALLVSLFPDSVGAASVNRLVPNGQTSFTVYMQALDGVTAPSVTLTATEARFTTGTTTIAVVQPGIELQGVPSSTTTLSGPFPYYAQVGLPNGNNTGLSRVQNRRGGAPPINVTFTTLDTLIVRVVDSLNQPNGGLNGTAPLRSQFYYTPSSGPATGGISGRPMGAGVDTLKVTAPGFVAQSIAARGITVTQPTISVAANYGAVGSGLVESGSVSLSAGSHGGATVTVTSANPSVMLIDTLPNGVGHASIVKPLANGQTFFSLYYQAIEGQAGNVTVTATEPRFATGSVVMQAARPGVEVQGVPGSLTTLSPNANFYAQIGVLSPDSNSLARVQNRRGGASGPLVATFTATPASVGNIIDSVTPAGAATGTARVPLGLYYTNGSGPASGGVTLHPILNGSVAVTVAIPGFRTANISGTRSVTISQPGITVGLFSQQIGSGLQDAANVTLGASNHGGTTITLTSSDPSILRVSQAQDSLSAASIQVVIPNGQTNYTFYVHGMEGATGTPTITATASGFTNGTASGQIVTPAIDLQGGGTYTAGSADQVIYAQVGLPNGQLTALSRVQNVRAGSPSPVTVTFVSSTPGVGTLVNTAQGAGTPRTAVIEPVLYYTPTSVAGGGVAFRPLTVGSTNLSATAPGFTPMANATRVATVQ